MKMLIRVCISFVVLFAMLNTSAQSDIETTRELYNEYLSARSNGQHFQAREKLLQILPFQSSIPPYNRAVLHNSLGYISWQLGLFKRSKAYYLEANQIIQDFSIEIPLLQAGNYSDQGILNKQIGEYESAKEYFENAELILYQRKQKDINYYEHLSMVLFNKSLVYIKTKEYSQALGLLHQAERIKEKHNFEYVGSVYFNLARCYTLTRIPKDAEYYYSKSIAQWIQESGPNHFELANIYLEYAQFLSKHGDDERAEEFFEKAIYNYLTNYGPQHPYTASCYSLISDTHYSKSEFQEALDYSQKALIAICPEFNNSLLESNPAGMESTNDLRLLKIYTNKIKALVAHANSQKLKGSQKQIDYLDFAFKTSEESVKVLERIQETYLSQESRLFLTQNQKELFIRGIDIARQLHELSGDPAFVEKAYLFSAYGKTLELNFEIRQKEHLYIHSLQDSSAYELVATKESVESYSHLIQAEQSKQNPDSSMIDSWKQTRFDLRREYEAIHEAVFGSDIETASPNLLERNTLDIIQSRLNRNQSLLEYTISSPDEHGNGKLFAFVVDNKKFHFYNSEIDSSFYRDIEKIQTKLHGYDPYNTNSGEIESLNMALSNLFIGLIYPLEKWIKNDHLIIITDDELGDIPFEALIRNSSQIENNLEGVPYLIHNYEISYASNASLLDNQLSIRIRRPQLKVISQDYAHQVRGGLNYLSSVTKETEAVLSIMKGNRVSTTHSKEDIIYEIVEADLVHFALHLFPSNQDQSSSFMVLHQNPDSVLNNLLFDYEIDPLNLSTSMIVINACESGSGQFHQGEGMLSLSRSFMLAGAKSVINALWSVDDKAGSSIMISFYKNLAKGNSKAKALRIAKLTYLENSTPTFAHPYYWAGYQLMGNRSPLLINRWIIPSCLAAILTLILVFYLSRRRNRIQTT